MGFVRSGGVGVANILFFLPMATLAEAPVSKLGETLVKRRFGNRMAQPMCECTWYHCLIVVDRFPRS